MGQELIQHNKIGAGHIHRLTNWRFQDTASRMDTANNFTAFDIDKLAYDLETEKYYFLKAIASGTGAPTWYEVPELITSVGEANTISSVGGGLSLVAGKVGVDLQVRSLAAGSGVSFGVVGNLITISAAASAPAWGSITGLLSNQTDLWTQLQNRPLTSEVAPIGHTHSLATGSAAGFLSPTLYTKLVDLETNATHTGDVAGSVILTIQPNAVSWTKLQDFTTNGVILGRATAGAGDPEELTLGTGFSIVGTTINVVAASDTIITKLAGEVMSGHRVVSASSADDVLLSTNANYNSVRGVLGLVLTAAASLGDPVQVQTSGVVTEGSWSWSVGDVWLSAAGVLTQTQPTTGYLFHVGTALSATELKLTLVFIAQLS